MVLAARQRGRDSSGFAFKEIGCDHVLVERADYDINKLLSYLSTDSKEFVLGHSRLITNSHGDNQPVVKEDILVFHNGIIVNANELWKRSKIKQNLAIDTEILAALTEEYITSNLEKNKITGLSDYILGRCEGVVAAAILVGRLGKLVLFSNN